MKQTSYARHMMFVFAGCITLGALLFHTFHISLGFIGLTALIIFLSISFVFRTKRSFVFAICITGAIVVGAFVMSQQVAPHIILGKRDFQATVVSISSGGNSESVIAKDMNGTKYSFTTTTNVLPGDTISIYGLVQLPEDFITSTERIFPYQEYLEAHGVNAVIKQASVKIISNGKFGVTRFLTQAQLFFTNIYTRYISYPSDSVVAGMVLGVQGGITDDIKNLFLVTGTLHTLVLSGYNITLVASLLGMLLRAAPVKIRTTLSAIGIIFLVGVSGVGVAALRAGIMGVLALIATVTRRTYDPLRGLVFAYLFFFFLSPFEIFSDPGFHLSFLATFSIIVLYPIIEKRFVTSENKAIRTLQETFTLSTFMPLIMLPYFMYFSGVFGLSSPIANVFASLFVPIITIAGMVILVISFVTPLASLVGILLSKLVGVFLWILKLCAYIPIWNTPPLSWWSVLSLYMFIIGVFFKQDLLTFLKHVHSALRQQPS